MSLLLLLQSQTVPFNPCTIKPSVRNSGPGLPPLEAADAGGGGSTLDPTEPVYCYCRRVSFGEMVACDNPDCAVEWFHFECVGMDAQPKGKWYCRDCEALKEAGKLPS